MTGRDRRAGAGRPGRGAGQPCRDDVGLADAAGRMVRTYSGGMRRRLDLAASLMHSPPLLVLDEPTTGLDPASRQRLWTVLTQLQAQGTTMLLTTQYLEEADRYADIVHVLDHGKVIASGTPGQLKAQAGTAGTSLDEAFLALTGSTAGDMRQAGDTDSSEIRDMRGNGTGSPEMAS